MKTSSIQEFEYKKIYSNDLVVLPGIDYMIEEDNPLFIEILNAEIKKKEKFYVVYRNKKAKFGSVCILNVIRNKYIKFSCIGRMVLSDTGIVSEIIEDVQNYIFLLDYILELLHQQLSKSNKSEKKRKSFYYSLEPETYAIKIALLNVATDPTISEEVRENLLALNKAEPYDAYTLLTPNDSITTIYSSPHKDCIQVPPKLVIFGFLVDMQRKINSGTWEKSNYKNFDPIQIMQSLIAIFNLKWPKIDLDQKLAAPEVIPNVIYLIQKNEVDSAVEDYCMFGQFSNKLPVEGEECLIPIIITIKNEMQVPTLGLYNIKTKNLDDIFLIVNDDTRANISISDAKKMKEAGYEIDLAHFKYNIMLDSVVIPPNLNIFQKENECI